MSPTVIVPPLTQLAMREEECSQCRRGKHNLCTDADVHRNYAYCCCGNDINVKQHPCAICESPVNVGFDVCQNCYAEWWHMEVQRHQQALKDLFELKGLRNRWHTRHDGRKFRA